MSVTKGSLRLIYCSDGNNLEMLWFVAKIMAIIKPFPLKNNKYLEDIFL